MISRAHPEEHEELQNEPTRSVNSSSDMLQVMLIGVLLGALVFGFVLGLMPGQPLRG